MSDQNLNMQNEKQDITKYSIMQIEKMKLCREDFEDQESYQKMRALRRAIRKFSKEKKSQKEQRMVSYKSIRVQDVQLYQNLDFTQKLFMFYGDFFVMTDHNQVPNDIVEQISFFKHIKYVLSAEKIDSKQIVFLNVLTKDTIMYTPLEVLQEVINSKPDDKLLQEFFLTFNNITQILKFKNHQFAIQTHFIIRINSCKQNNQEMNILIKRYQNTLIKILLILIFISITNIRKLGQMIIIFNLLKQEYPILLLLFQAQIQTCLQILACEMDLWSFLLSLTNRRQFIEVQFVLFNSIKLNQSKVKKKKLHFQLSMNMKFILL
ncbi:hypothetical protein ABPG72_018406 [Tetrahymena utriculariae]